MMTAIYNVKSRKCAFCKYWYDPTNSNISPKSPNMGVWQILDTTKKLLALRRIFRYQLAQHVQNSNASYNYQLLIRHIGSI